MKRFKFADSKLMLVALSLLIGLPVIAIAATFQRFTVQDSQIYLLEDDGSVTLAGNLSAVDLTASDDLTVTDRFTRRSATVAHSTSVSTGNTFPCVLRGSTNAVTGHLLIAAASSAQTTEGCVVTVADDVIDQTGWIGVAAGAATIGNTVLIYTSGFVMGRTTGTVVAGDTLVSSNNANTHGHLETDITPTTGADVAVSFGTGVTTGGLTLIRLR